MATAVAGAASKKAARTAARAALRAVSSEAMAEESAAVAKHLLSCGVFERAQTIGLYVHCAKLREVDTGELLAAACALKITSVSCRARACPLTPVSPL